MMKAYSAKDLWAYEDMLYTLQSALNTAKVYEVFTKDEVIAMFKKIMLEIEEYSKRQYSMDECISEIGIDIIIQDKIDKLQEDI